MKRDKAGILLVLTMLVGVCVLLYPALSQYWNSKTQSGAVDDYRDISSSMTNEDCDALFAAAAAYNAALAKLDEPLLDYSLLDNYNGVLNISGSGVMGYITIEKLGVQLPIYHGTSSEVLNIACGHLEGTSLPGGGEGTHCVLSAHRGLPHAKLFTELDKMELGDTFTVTVLDRTFTYEVDSINVVSPDRVDDVRIIDGEDHCTLLTCTPYGINSHRLLVRGTRIENALPTLYVRSEAYKIDPLVASPAIAAPMLLVLLVMLMVKYRKKNSKALIPKEEEQ